MADQSLGFTASASADVAIISASPVLPPALSDPIAERVAIDNPNYISLGGVLHVRTTGINCEVSGGGMRRPHYKGKRVLTRRGPLPWKSGTMRAQLGRSNSESSIASTEGGNKITICEACIYRLRYLKLNVKYFKSILLI